MSNTKKLTKDKIEYLHILHAGWSIASYYSRLFGMDAGDEPAEMQTYLLEREGITFVRFKFPSCDTALTGKEYSFGEIKEIMQQHLQYRILPSDKILRPYMGGSTIYDIVEPLYIDRVEESKGIWRIHAVYVDNPLAFQYVQSQKWQGGYIL